MKPEYRGLFLASFHGRALCKAALLGAECVNYSVYEAKAYEDVKWSSR